MRRSSSSSSIPQRLSRLPVRESLHPGQSGKGIPRPQGPEKNSLTKSSRTSSNPNLLDIPYIRNQRSGSLVRQTLATPSSQSRYSRLQRKSPGWSSLKKDSRPITDKHWQYDQLSKVRNFVAKNFGHLELYDTNSIKSGITMDLFVSLINNYFQLLDNQVFVMRDNYVDEVPKILKLFGYPVNVKPSLMKTVNTPHSWPHILAIFSWLSELITDISIPEDYKPFSGLHDVIFQHTLDLLKQLHHNKAAEEVTRQKCLDKIDKEIVGYLKLDVNLLADIDNQIERLQFDIDKCEHKNEELKTNIKVVQTETKELTEKCDKYEQGSKTFLTQLELQKNKHMEKISKIGEEVLALKDEEKRLQNIVDSQPFNLVQKEELNKELTSLQMSKDLKEQRQQQQQKLIHEYDSKLTQLTQSIKSNAYKYNNMINNLELSNPEFKKLHIRESGFLRMDTDKELNGIHRLLQVATEKLKKDTQERENEIQNLSRKEKKLCDVVEDSVKEVEELNKLESELALTCEFENKQIELNRKKLVEEINKGQYELEGLKKLRLDLVPLENQVDALQKQKVELAELYQNNKSESLFFFQNLHKQMNQTAASYMEIMKNVSDTFSHSIDTAEKKLEIPLVSEAALEVQKEELK